MTPAEIAARLTPAQRRALLWFSPDGKEARPTDRKLFDSARVLVCKGLLWWCDGRGRGFVVSPLGQQVRAIVEQEQQPLPDPPQESEP